ncbi:MAG: hypothetical protein GXP45_07790 [bacterium]|nr:hypothetical protein [bacterium]
MERLQQYNKFCHEKGINCAPIPQQARRADQIRIKAVQNAGQTNFQDINTGLQIQIQEITTLQKSREYPLIFAQRFLPIHKESEQTMSQKKDSREQSINL